MEQDLLEEVVGGQEGVQAGGEERALEPGLVGIVSAPIVGRSFLTKWEPPAIV